MGANRLVILRIGSEADEISHATGPSAVLAVTAQATPPTCAQRSPLPIPLRSRYALRAPAALSNGAPHARISPCR